MPKKEDFYSYLHMEEITDKEYTHAKKRLCKDFEIRNFEDSHNLYVKWYIIVILCI